MTTMIAVEDRNAIQQISLELLDASRNNPRRTMNEADLAELAASIREHGIQVPLLVRPIGRAVCVTFEDGSSIDTPLQTREECAELLSRPDVVEAQVEDHYEIVCGHRRSEAATIAGLESVPCIVREMDDATAAEIALIDNLQRVDVPPLEEAEAFGVLLDRLLSIPAVAAKVGKEQSYVAKRLKLRDLTVWSQDALRKRLITIDHALLLARLASAEQNEALKWCLDPNAGVKATADEVVEEALESRQTITSWSHPWEPESVTRLKQHIEQKTGEKLDRAPWPMEEDYLLPDAGSCLDCEKNTKANAPLFGDLAIGEPTCTDGECYKAKTAGWVQIKLREAGQDLTKKPQKKVPRLSWKFSSVRPATGFNDDPHNGSMNTCADASKVLKAGQWIEAKKNSCPNVRPGVTVDWEDANDRGYMGTRSPTIRKPGETLQVCIACGCKIHRKGYEEAAKPNGASPQNSRESYEEEQRKRRAAVLVENQLRMGWAITAVGQVKKLSEVALRAALIEALENCDCDEQVIGKHLFPKWREALETAPITSVRFAQAMAVLHIACNGLNLGDYSNPGDQREAYIKAVKQLGTDPTSAWTAKKPAAEKKAATVAPAAKKPILSAEAKKRIADAQKKRWADQAKKKGGRK